MTVDSWHPPNSQEGYPAPWGYANGLRFYAHAYGVYASDAVRDVEKMRELMLLVGQYATRNMALEVVQGGAPYDKMTVNLKDRDPRELRGSEFWVHYAFASSDMATRLRMQYVFSPVYERGSHVVSAQGHVKRYAELWRFADCPSPTQKGHMVTWSVACPGCQKDREQVHEDIRIKLLADDTVRMLLK